MEDILHTLLKEATGTKYSILRKACQDTLDLLEDPKNVNSTEPYILREKCLQPLQLALESKNSKFATYALGGIQKMVTDSRFESTIESEEEKHWLPMQILDSVWNTSFLPEDVQVEVMKTLMNMTFSTSWCMNAKVVTRISELCFGIYVATSKMSLRYIIVKALLKMMKSFYHRHTSTSSLKDKDSKDKVVTETYGASITGSVRTAARATLTQLLSAIAETLNDKHALREVEANSAIAEFTGGGSGTAATESLSDDLVNILLFLCEKLTVCQRAGQRQTEPLLLEGVYAILKNIPTQIRDNPRFVKLVWQELCPHLVSILGNPLTDKSVTSGGGLPHQDEVGRGSGCSNNAPNVHFYAAKTIYNIAVELVRLVGCLQSLRPVLESVFHRMLLYPPPVHRLEAIKALKELLSTPGRLLDLAGPTIADDDKQPANVKKKANTDLDLLKLIVDSLSECCQCQETSVCLTSVGLVTDLLATIEALVQGEGMTQEQVEQILETESSLEAAAQENSTETSQNYLTPDDPYNKFKLQNAESPALSAISSDNESMNEMEERLKSLHDQTAIELHYRNSKNSGGKLNADERAGDSDGTAGVEKVDYDAVDREGARQYVQKLTEKLPHILGCYSVTEADEMIQQLASDVCAVCIGEEATILNADGVYVATYSVLLLNLKLIKAGYYNSQEKSLPMSEQQFLDELLGCGLLLYVPRAWLSELFLHVISNDMLSTAGYKDSSDTVLRTLLLDMDGLGSRISEEGDGGRQIEKTEQTSNAAKAGQVFSRRVLVVCWDSVLTVLSVLISGRHGSTNSLHLMFNAREENRRAREAMCGSLDSLQRAAKLCCVLGLQERCGAVFQQLANASCVVEERSGPEPPTLLSRPKLARLHTAHALSLHLVLGKALEMGSHAQDCWSHVFRCCAHVCELEHTYFSGGRNQATLPKVEQKHVDMPTEFIDETDPYSSVNMAAVEPVAPTIDVPELIRQSSSEGLARLDAGAGKVLSAEKTSKVLCGLAQQVDSLFEQACDQLTMTSLVEFLSELCAASKQQLHTWPPHHDNVPIHTLSSPSSGPASSSASPVSALHLYRLGDVVLRCVHSDRPLMHIMRLWSVVSVHLVEAACHKDRSISKKAVQCLHEVVTTLLRPELPHFSFHESLCKPFENLLCLELCDGDVQDQIVCSICELVEACTSEIKSGWRPLFGALRAVKIEYTASSEEVNEARQRHVSAVLDVFEVFLNTDNTLVFANAAIDCILCLLKYVRGKGELEDYADDDDDIVDDSSDSGSELCRGGSASEDLILPALRYLERCCGILADMWKMPACPVFNGAHRIRTSAKLHVVDCTLPDMDLQAFQTAFHSASHSLQQDKASANQSPAKEKPPANQQPCNNGTKPQPANESAVGEESAPAGGGGDNKSLNSLDSGIGGAGEGQNGASSEEKPHVNPRLSYVDDSSCDSQENCDINQLNYKGRSLDELDKQTGVLHVWFLVLEGLASTISEGPRNYQPQTLEMLFTLLRSAAQVPGAEFCLHCVNHLLLPTVQSWLRKGNTQLGYWDAASIANFKHCTGLCADLVVEYIVAFTSDVEHADGVELMLKQLLDVLTECVAQPNEPLSRLGCSCIRHSLLSCGSLFTERLWQVVAGSLCHAITVSLYALQQLMTPFQPDSDNFYGDVGQVKVAVRKDCTAMEALRLRTLAHQVFLLDSQRTGCTMGLADQDEEDSHNYTFLIFAPDAPRYVGDTANITADPVARVAFRRVVVGLLAHQLLIQTVGSLLLEGAAAILQSQSPTSPTTNSDNLMQDQPLPGFLRFMSSRNVLKLLQCLQYSYQTAEKFDSRPGLKFLIQKVAKLDVAANMYKQTGISMLFHVHTLLEICAHQNNLCAENSKQIIWGRLTQDEEKPADFLEEIRKASLEAHISTSVVQSHTLFYVHRLKDTLDEIRTNYIDLYLEREGPNAADRLSKQLLVFLVAPDEIATLKRDKSIKEMVEEKLRERKRKEDEGRGIGVMGAGGMSSAFGMTAEAVNVQDDDVSGGSSPALSTQVSPHSSPKKENHKTQQPPPKHEGDKVYNVATDRTIKTLMSEYKKRKQTHTMPRAGPPAPGAATHAAFVRQGRSKPLPSKEKRPRSDDPVDRQIEEQQKTSIMKDSDAHLMSYVELLCELLQLYHKLSDAKYRALLPVVFPTINQLVCHVRHKHLRMALAQWTFRMGQMWGLVGPEDVMPSNPRD